MTINTNIFIIGAGVSGIAAAVSASRKGKKVVLIDNHSYPGGAAIAAEVGTVCGLYKNGRNIDSSFLTDGFAREFALKTAEYSDASPQQNQFGVHFLPYKTDSLKNLLEDYIADYQINFISDAVLTELIEENGLLNTGRVKQYGKELIIKFDAVIDCSGRAIAAELTDHPLIESDYFQAASINFYVTNSNVGDNEISNFKLIRDLKTIIQQQKLPDYCKNLFIIPGSETGETIGFKFTIPWEVSHKKGDIERLTIRAKKLVEEVFLVLKTHSSLFTDASIKRIADDLGWRTGKRPVGQYILTEEDVVNAKKWKNAVAKSAWPIEDWLPNKTVDIQYVRDNDYYEIPQECLISLKFENLFFAGRIISATDRAIASARVMGVCLQTGYAAGQLASAFRII